MMTIDKRIDNFLLLLSSIRIQEIDVKEFARLLGTNVASQGCLLMQDNRVVYQHKSTLEQIKAMQDNYFSEEFETSGLKYRIYLVFEPDDILEPDSIEKLKTILKVISQIISVSNVAKERISEFQVINELNLNVITTLELKKVVWFVESAAQKLLNTNRVFLYYLIEDQLVGRNKKISIKFLPDETYRQISQSRQILKLEKFENRFLKCFLDNLNPGIVLIVPFTIKNQGRGFFLLDDFDKIPNQINAIMRLKFLGNQAAIALERIELFQALNRALQESRGLQDIAKLLLSPYELKHFFTEVLRRAQQILGFKKIMCSVYNSETDSFERFHSVGISLKKFREAKKVHPPYKIIKSLMEDRFRISNSYYIPSEEAFKEIREYEVYKVSAKQKRAHNLWSQGDILISPIYSRNGEILGILSLSEPVDNRIPDRSKIRLLEAFGDFLGLAMDNSKLFERNLIISYTDDLTGVYNYRFLREKLNELIEKLHKPIAIAMIDLDRFKEYNDRYGHLAGDQLLKKISQILRDVIKDGYVTRYGGDEFIVILPGSGVRAIKSRIERAKKVMHNLKDGRLQIDFSCGFAVYPEDGTDFGTLIDSADKRLYLEKRRKYETVAS
uniref:Sensor domain-containing diguanylate cyclase n=1 Tax=candidate division WOR-3 bacterium TaxID=2052148 RepID=A0A7C6EKK4_UNCW3